MRLTLPKIYPITDRKLSGLSHAEQVRRLIDGGATLVQLREKHLSPIDFLRDAEAASKVAGNNRVTLIINDRVDIAMAINAGGIHLGQDDMPVEAARRLVRNDTLIGFSTHTQQQAETAVRSAIDYLAFGPVFRTSTKPDHDPVVGLKQLRAVRNIAADFPLVAIGGISAANVQAVLEAGADSVAVISAVVGERSKIEQNMRSLLELAGV
ncbi:MAG TPA: thiamine phosphate synthase [Pyrinomonadaceae bacterium]|nr:thiamine phosphate synthase [Pyrinomonadaceae bacterium]